MVSIGVLFVSTVSVSLYAVPKILYHRGILAQPSQATVGTQRQMANESYMSTSALGENMGSEEIAELRLELSEMRNVNMELRETNMELQVELKQLKANGPV